VIADTAYDQAIALFNDLAALPANTNITGVDLAGQTLTPGVYRSLGDAILSVSAPLNLDAQDDPNTRFIFQIAGNFNPEALSSIVLINSASPCNVLFQIGSSFSIGDGTSLVGTFLVSGQVLGGIGGSITGRTVSLNNDTILNTNIIAIPTCTFSPL
jgi:hypothetical protein